MVLYAPVLKSTFRISGLPAVEQDGKTDDSYAEVWFTGPGFIDGGVDMEIRGDSSQVELRKEGPVEIWNPTKLSRQLFYFWMGQAKSNLEEEYDTGRTDKDSGEAITGVRPLDITKPDILNKRFHPLHRRYLQRKLAAEFYPEMFEDVDPNSFGSGKSGTTGTDDGSTPGSKTEPRSRQPRSPNPPSSGPSSTGE